MAKRLCATNVIAQTNERDSLPLSLYRHFLLSPRNMSTTAIADAFGVSTQQINYRLDRHVKDGTFKLMSRGPGRSRIAYYGPGPGFLSLLSEANVDLRLLRDIASRWRRLLPAAPQ